MSSASSLAAAWRRSRRLLPFVLVACCLAGTLPAQDLTPELIREAARRTGLAEGEIARRYREQMGQAPAVADTAPGPGRTSLGGIDDRAPRAAAETAAPAGGRGERSYWIERPEIALPLSGGEASSGAADSSLTALAGPPPLELFGRTFFRLPAGVFTPPSFGPVPADYLIGVGDEIVVDAWGEVELHVERVVDRDGSIILPRGGKVVCQNRSLAAVGDAIRDRLAGSYAGIADGSIRVDVSLGRLRAIRVFVIGDVEQPGGYELSSVATLLTAIYAAGGPTEGGSLRDLQLVRAGKTVASLDLYRYLLSGVRDGDEVLREGDTVLVPPRGRTVLLQGAVRRPAYYELRDGETLADLIGFAGGFTPQAAAAIVHVERIVPPALRRDDLPDRTFLDVDLDPATGGLVDPAASVLLDGDIVTVDQIEDKLWGWVEIVGHVKRPGRYQFNQGLTVRELVERAGGAWPDVLLEVAIIDRIDLQERLSSVTLPLGAVLRGEAADVPLQERDVLRVFALGEMLDRETVTINGEVRQPDTYEYRRGLTLRDLIVRAGGIPATGDLAHVEVQRLQPEKVFSAAAEKPTGATVQTLVFDLSPNYLQRGGDVLLQPYDQVVVRRLPWYEQQRLVTVKGEVFYNGVFSLEREDERLSGLVERAGGLKPTAFARGARVERAGLGNVAVDLEAAMAEPGGPQDIILEAGDRLLVPQQQYTVKVVGEVGFPTALVHEDGRRIDWYVDRAGGYLDKADRQRTRVVHPNGLSQPNKGGHEVLPGSTIVVPVEPPPEGPTTLETLKEISVIFASLATVWLVIDKTTE
ncbi:MAG TPA: SLBB domain-containing protein [Candidatus Krumholzibacteria bacterium]|nr:SLBB domain-containing protein [Candidatus Krumholzibacteria bacterium]HPD71313.1 SLBB domain-containing protein [Candidatus Krumholzibacteria bacterium]HRY38987.1 SLBB domain-containing protein [Candidatus Krumholzibacteria bacterium]